MDKVFRCCIWGRLYWWFGVKCCLFHISVMFNFHFDCGVGISVLMCVFWFGCFSFWLWKMCNRWVLVVISVYVCVYGFVIRYLWYCWYDWLVCVILCCFVIMFKPDLNMLHVFDDNLYGLFVVCFCVVLWFVRYIVLHYTIVLHYAFAYAPHVIICASRYGLCSALQFAPCIIIRALALQSTALRYVNFHLVALLFDWLY